MSNLTFKLVANGFADVYFETLKTIEFPEHQMFIEDKGKFGFYVNTYLDGVLITRKDNAHIAYVLKNKIKKKFHSNLVNGFVELLDPLSTQAFQSIFVEHEDIKKNNTFLTIEEHVRAGCTYALMMQQKKLKKWEEVYTMPLHTRSLAISLYLYGFDCEDIQEFCTLNNHCNVARIDLFDWVVNKCYELHDYMSREVAE